MFVKIKKKSEHIVLVSLTKEEFEERYKGMLLLERGINEIMHRPEVRDELINKYGTNGELILIIPEMTRDDNRHCSLISREIKITEIREEHSDTIKYEVITGRRQQGNEEKR